MFGRASKVVKLFNAAAVPFCSGNGKNVRTLAVPLSIRQHQVHLASFDTHPPANLNHRQVRIGA